MRRRLVLFMLLGLALASAAPPAHAQSVALRFVTSAPPDSATRGALAEWSHNVATRTGGRVTLVFLVVGDEQAAANKLATGAVDAATLSGIRLEGIQPAVRVLDVPFLFASDEQLDSVREKMDGDFRKLFADKGYVLLAWGDAGPLRLFSSKAIPTIDELGKTKVGAAGDIMFELNRSLASAATTSLVADPSVLPSRVESGGVDAIGAYYGSSATTLRGWNGKVTHATSMIVARPTAATLVTKKFFDALTPEQQTILLQESRVLQQKLIADARTEEASALEKLKTKGLVNETTPDEVVKKFREVASSIGPTFNNKALYPPDLRTRVESVRDGAPPPPTTTTTSTPPAPITPTGAGGGGGAGGQALAWPLPIGAEVALFHPTHKRYMRIDGNAKFVVNGPGQGTAASALPASWKWERFRVIDAGKGRVALYNQELKRFVRLNSTHDVDSTASADPYALPAAWNLERFEVQLQPDGRVALYQADLKRYVSMKSDYDFEGATTPMGFDVGVLTAPSLVPGSVVALFHQTEKCFVRIHGNTGLADCAGHKGTAAELPAEWTWERFLVVDGGAGRVALYNTTTKRFLRMTPASPPAGVKANELDSSERASADLPADWAWERFTVEVRGLGVVALSNHTPGTYLSPPGAAPVFDLRAGTTPGLYLVHVLKAAPTAAAAQK